MSRIDQLREMLAQDPNDVFLRYALGMELKGLEEFDEALQLFRGLMSNEPPHVPSFFMAGQSLVEAEQINEARDVLRIGIEEARRQGDMHAAGEMSEFLTSLGTLGE
ncbi:MAG: hypothetical protein R3C03_10745 [Pirellulaceae bacterium]